MDDWRHALTTQVAGNIEHFRRVRGLTRTQLADRCTAIGLRTKRPALSALLDGHRQTITLQELVVLAEALDTSVAELIVPLHTGRPTISGPGGEEDLLTAAQRLFAIPDDTDTDTAGPYRPYLRFRRAARRFERANQRLAELSHKLATGELEASTEGGRPHPATEILAAEAALSRLITARDTIAAAGLDVPALPDSWRFLSADQTPPELPLLDLIAGRSALLPVFVYRLAADHLPEPCLVANW
jgi:hypothetical protein